MAKDLTSSRIDRQNILNNDLALQEIYEKSEIPGILWEGKIYLTRDGVADFFEVDKRTIGRYIEQNEEELKHNGYEVLIGKRLKSFLTASHDSFAKDINVLSKISLSKNPLFCHGKIGGSSLKWSKNCREI